MTIHTHTKTESQTRVISLDVRRQAQREAERRNKAHELFEEANKLDNSKKTANEAERLYRNALNLYPDFAAAWLNLGVLLSLHFDRPSEAIQCFEQAISFEPTNARAHYNYAYVIESKDEPKAIRHYMRAVELDTYFAWPLVQLAFLHELHGRLDEARSFWNRYLTVDPSGDWVADARRFLKKHKVVQLRGRK